MSNDWLVEFFNKNCGSCAKESGWCIQVTVNKLRHEIASRIEVDREKTKEVVMDWHRKHAGFLLDPNFKSSGGLITALATGGIVKINPTRKEAGDEFR